MDVTSEQSTADINTTQLYRLKALQSPINCCYLPLNVRQCTQYAVAVYNKTAFIDYYVYMPRESVVSLLMLTVVA